MKNEIVSLDVVDDELVIDWQDGKQSRLYSHWLRDHCQMPSSRDAVSGQRLLNISQIPIDTYLASAKIDDEGEVVLSFQPEDHESRFTQKWLQSNCYCLNPQQDDRSEESKTLWQGDSFASGLPEVDYALFCQAPEQKARALQYVQALGFVLLRDVPVIDRQVLEVIRQFGFIRETNYGELFEVRPTLDANNLAFTNQGVGTHADNPYRDPVPSVQLLHCLENSAEGGDSVMVDGFKAATILREENEAHFKMLSGTWVNYRFRDSDTELLSRCPMIETDDLGRIVKVRYNNRSIASIQLPPEKIRGFYQAYRHWAEILEREELKICYKLNPGDLVLFDNTRAMHARTAFSKGGKRHLQGAYSDLDGLYSTLNVLQRAEEGRKGDAIL